MPAIPEPTVRKSVTLPERTWNEIGQYRFYQTIPTEAEALRQLVQRGINAPLLIKIMTGEEKFFLGRFDEARRDPFAGIDLLAAEIREGAPFITTEEATKRATAIFERAKLLAGDFDAAVSLVNLDWRLFA